MDTPRILAIADVRLKAPVGVMVEMVGFYVDEIGLVQDTVEAGEGVVFRGCRRRGPRLIVEPIERPIVPSMRRAAVIQVGSLASCAQRLTEKRVALVWSQGWSFYDQRVTVLDPAENRVELVAIHAF